MVVNYSLIKFKNIVFSLAESFLYSSYFEYEVYTDNKDKYYIKVCVCDESTIKSLDKSKVETENIEPQAEQPQVFSY